MSHGVFTLCVTASALTAHISHLGSADVRKVAAAPRGSSHGACGSPVLAGGLESASTLVDRPKLLVWMLGSGNFDA